MYEVSYVDRRAEKPWTKLTQQDKAAIRKELNEYKVKFHFSKILFSNHSIYCCNIVYKILNLGHRDGCTPG